MPTYTPIMAPEGTQVQVHIQALLNATGGLTLRAGDPIEDIATHVAIGCDQEQTVRTIIQNFNDATGTPWNVSAATKLRSTAPWTQGVSEVYDEGSGFTDWIEVTVTAQANGTGETKTKTIHVQTKSRKSLPDPTRPLF